MTKVVDLSNFGDPRANDEKNKQTEGEENKSKEILDHGVGSMDLFFFF